MNWPLSVAFAALMPPALSFGPGRLFSRIPLHRGLGMWFAIAAWDVAIFAMIGRWVACGGSAVSAAVAAILWWWNRRKRNRAPLALGAKSKALRDALVRRLRQVAKPRPVLRPAPGGAR